MIAEKAYEPVFIGNGFCAVVYNDLPKLMRKLHSVFKALYVLRYRSTALWAGRKLRVKWCVAFLALHDLSS